MVTKRIPNPLMKVRLLPCLLPAGTGAINVYCKIENTSKVAVSGDIYPVFPLVVEVVGRLEVRLLSSTLEWRWVTRTVRHPRCVILHLKDDPSVQVVAKAQYLVFYMGTWEDEP